MSKPVPEPAELMECSLHEGGRIVDDAWTTIETADDLRVVADDAAVVVPLALWTAERMTLLARRGPVGVRLAGSDDPASIASDLAHVKLIAIDFPKFTDGRGYSIARLLRERYGYAGPLRAVGDVLRDQVFYMLRCGFDSFALKHRDHLDDALTAWRDFSDAYQTSVDRKQPSFARRSAAVDA